MLCVTLTHSSNKKEEMEICIQEYMHKCMNCIKYNSLLNVRFNKYKSIMKYTHTHEKWL